MKSFNQWKLQESVDPDWDDMKRVWGGGQKHVNAKIVNMFSRKVEKFKESMVEQIRQETGNDRIENFRDIPLGKKDEIAQALVVAVLKSFYETAGNEFNANQPVPLGQRMSADTPMSNPNATDNTGDTTTFTSQAPEGWKG